MRLETELRTVGITLHIRQRINQNTIVTVEARRVDHPDRGDEAQVLFDINSAGGIGAHTVVATLVLKPDEARKLALALCPELEPINLAEG